MLPSRLLLFTVSLLLLFSLFTSNTIYASDLDEEEDDKEFEELLALDEQEEQEGEAATTSGKSEAEVLSKAQRIVLELNIDNVKRVIDGTEYVLVLGYAPWCERSAELMPKFAEAATLLKELNSPLLMAKLDADRHTKAASLLQIKGFPTLLLFVNGTSHAYSGGFSVNDIVVWARKKTGVPVVRVISVKEAEEFLNKYPTFVLGVFDKFEGPEYEEFLKSAAADNEIQFVETSSTEVAKVLYPTFKSAKQFLGIVKSEPERYTEYEGTFEMNKILQFLDYNKFPLVTKLTDINSVSVYSSPIKLQVMVFAKDAEFENLLGPLESVARKFKEKLMFIYVDITDENNAKPFLTLFGLENSENTVVTAFDNRISAKFLLEDDPTQSNIEEFCSKFLSGTLSPHFKSQPIPDNTNARVQIVVGKTFDDLVLNNPKNVFLEVHTPWCFNCESTSKQVEKLAKHFKNVDSLVFASFDASANEHPKMQIVDYPTLLFYPADNKANPIKMQTKSSSKELAAFINQQVKGKDQGRKDEL